MLTKKHLSLLVLALLLIFNLILFIATVNKGLPQRDSGAFLYIASQILQGKIPYLDIWDNKPPLVYYIDSLGLIIDNGGLKGVWLIELIFSSSSVVIGFTLLKKAFGIVPAFLSILAWQTTFYLIFEGGNLTEEFAAPFQFLIYYLFYQGEVVKKWGRVWLFIGLASASLFFLKQNLIGVFLAIIIYNLILFISTKKIIYLKRISLLSLGFSLIVLLVITYLSGKSALNYFWDSAFYFNFIYSAGPHNLFNILAKGFQLTSRAFLSYFALIGFILASLQLIFVKNSQVHSLLKLFVLALPIELLLSVMSGFSFPHYFLPWLPTMTLLLGFLIYKIRFLLLGERKFFYLKISYLLCLIILMTAVLYPCLKTLSVAIKVVKNQLSNFSFQTPTNSEITRFIITNTKPQDYVLIWGNEVGINFISRRQSPTKYVFQYSLYTPLYQKEAMSETFLNDIITKQPKLVIDGHRSYDPTPGLNCKREMFSELTFLPNSKMMEKANDYICNNYQLEKRVDDHWDIYFLKLKNNLRQD